jgi:hypothetical protein
MQSPGTPRRPDHQALLDHMKRQWGDRIGLMDVG